MWWKSAMPELSSWLLNGTGGNAASSGQNSVAKLEFVVMIEFVMAGLRQQGGCAVQQETNEHATKHGRLKAVQNMINKNVSSVAGLRCHLPSSGSLMPHATKAISKCDRSQKDFFLVHEVESMTDADTGLIRDYFPSHRNASAESTSSRNAAMKPLRNAAWFAVLGSCASEFARGLVWYLSIGYLRLQQMRVFSYFRPFRIEAV